MLTGLKKNKVTDSVPYIMRNQKTIFGKVGF